MTNGPGILEVNGGNGGSSLGIIVRLLKTYIPYTFLQASLFTITTTDQMQH